MNWLTILIYLLNIRGEGNLFNIEKVFFLENNFWFADQVQFKTDKGYLSKVGIGVECKNGDTVNYVYYSEACYPLEFSKFGYVVLGNLMIKGISSILKSPKDDKFFLRFRFIFTDKPIKNFRDYKSYEGRIQEYVTYKLLEKMKDKKNSINLRSDGAGIRMEYIKEGFEGLIWMKILKFYEYIENLEENEFKEQLSKLENGSIFDLYYFENYSECFDNLRDFINDLRYFNLVEDDVFVSYTANSSKIFTDKTTTLKVAQFKGCLYKKFYEKLKKLYGIETDKIWEEIFDDCFDCFRDEILNNNIFLLIGGKYDIDYYIEELSNIIFNSVEKKQRTPGASDPEDKNYIFSVIINSLKRSLEKLQSRAVKELFKFEIHNHFPKLLKKNVGTLDDYIEIEKIVCDYHNMFVFIFNLYYGFNKEDSYSYFSPIFIDDYNLKIVDGIKIEFASSIKFGQIKGFDDKEEEVILEKDIEYFVDENILYCPTEVLKMKNIQEIEIITFDKKNNFKFKINEYE